MSKRDFIGKTVVITGGASGIGLATALAFAAQNANIVLVDMDADALGEQKKQFEAKGYPVLTITCDVTDEQACKDAVALCVEYFATISLLFNNAGITQRSLFEKTEPHVIKTVMDINFFGAVNMTKAALPHLVNSRGVIIANESIAGVAPLLGRCGYCASKHAMHGFFSTLRCELRHKGVHVMIVAPGFIKTNLQTRALGGDGNAATHAQTRIGRQQTVKFVGEQIYKAAVKEKKMVVFTFFGKAGYLISRFFPHFYERLMTRQFKSELDN